MIKEVLSIIGHEDALIIRNDLCGYNYSSRFECTNCTDNCPANGLKWTGKAWKLGECTLCGACVSVCQNHVFKLDEDALIMKSKSDEPMVISCTCLKETLPEKNKYRVSDVHCLKQLYPELLLYLLSNSSSLFIVSNQEICQKCQGFEESWLLDRMECFGHFTKGVHYVTSVESIESLLTVHTVEQISRRDFFRAMFRRSQKASLEIINEKLEDYSTVLIDEIAPNPVRCQPYKRIQFKRALNRLELDQKFGDKAFVPYRYLKVEKCDFCGICTKLCPSQALKISSHGDVKCLSYSPVLCTDCGLCQKVCLAGKIVWGNQIELEEFKENQTIPLASAEVDHCTVCGKTFYCYPGGSQSTCSVCNQPKQTSFLSLWKQGLA